MEVRVPSTEEEERLGRCRHGRRGERQIVGAEGDLYAAGPHVRMARREGRVGSRGEFRSDGAVRSSHEVEYNSLKERVTGVRSVETGWM